MYNHTEIINEFTLKYDVAGISYPNNHVLSIDFCPWMSNIFVAGYENGMICLFDIVENHPIRKFYDMNSIERVLSVSWMKSVTDENGYDVLLYGMFESGKIRFLDFKVNQETQNYIYQKILSQPNQASKRKNNMACCKSLNSFIVMSNVMGNHTFSIHRICT